MRYPTYVIDAKNQCLLDSNYEPPMLLEQDGDIHFVLDSQRYLVRDATNHGNSIEGSYRYYSFREQLPVWTESQFFLASKALQALEWSRHHRYCSRCGQATKRHSHEFAMYCVPCNIHHYPRVQPCVIMAITRGDSILLARAQHSTTAMFSILAGFVEIGETLEQAVARETMEEVGLKIKNLRYMKSQPWPFPSNLMIGFQAEYESGEFVLQQDEIAEADFYQFDQLPQIPVAGTIAHWMIQQVVS